MSKSNSVAKMQKILKACQSKGTNKYDLSIKESDIKEKDWYMRIDYEALRISNTRELVSCPYDLTHY